MPTEGRYSLSRRKKGVSTYLEVFLLISIALGASLAVFGTLQSYSSQVSEPSLSISYPSIRQGSGVALESVTISNTGPTAISGITVLNPEAPASASYCYSLWDPLNQSTISSTCKTLRQNPTSISLPQSLAPGASEVFELTVMGAGEFTIGASYSVTVATSSAAQETVDIVVVPA
jgi:hypothetical protein